MIVCVCTNISDKDIVNYVTSSEDTDFKSVTKNLSCCNQCEICKHDIQDIIQESILELGC